MERGDTDHADEHEDDRDHEGDQAGDYGRAGRGHLFSTHQRSLTNTERAAWLHRPARSVPLD